MYLIIEEQIENSFTKIDELLQFAKGARILIATDSNSRSKSWHGKITNSQDQKTGGIRGKQTSPYNK